MIFKDQYGKEYEVDPNAVKITWRIAAYGVVFNEKNEVLMLQPKGTSHWQFPGGQIEINETVDEALKREFLEEVGYKIDLKNKELLFFNESNFRYSNSEDYFHSLQLVFKVHLENVHQYAELIDHSEDNDEGEVSWKKIESLKQEDIQHTHWPVIKILQK